MRTLATLFRGPLGQSYLAFRQATLQCEDAAFEKGRYFHKICDQVAAAVSLHPELLVFLRELSRYSNVGVVVFSSGLREVWDIVLKREGLPDTVQVIGGGSISNHSVITSEVRGALVFRLRNVHGKYV